MNTQIQARESQDPRRCGRSGLSRLTKALLLLLPVIALTGCASIGPDRVSRDRFDYTAAVADSWKTQMLLNLVKIRYGDAPVFLDVGQVVAGYSFQREVSGTANFSEFFRGPVPHAITSIFGLGARASFNDAPTLTYSPMTGERFARSMMMPIPLSSIMSVLQAGWPVDLVFRLTVQSVNGVDNRRVAASTKGYVRPANTEIYTLLDELGRIQNSGDIGIRALAGTKGEALTLVFRPNLAAAVEQALRNVSVILGLDPTVREFRIVYGAVPSDDKEIALVSRSMFEVLLDLSSRISVPEAQVAEHRVGPTAEGDLGPDGTVPPLIRISSSADRPADVFVAVPYNGYWFSIDDRDIASKGVFSFLMFVFTFVETVSKEAAPILTIPTTR
jgi:hypothetical protein